MRALKPETEIKNLRRKTKRLERENSILVSEKDSFRRQAEFNRKRALTAEDEVVAWANRFDEFLYDRKKK